MLITNPILPPRAGYVEVVNADGQHVYQPTAETIARLAMEQELEAENTRLKAQIALQSQQQTFLEDCILEMADIVYA